jgi:hypothetical protein
VIQLGVSNMHPHQVWRKHCQLSVVKVDIHKDTPHVDHGMCRFEEVSVAVSVSNISNASKAKGLGVDA